MTDERTVACRHGRECGACAFLDVAYGAQLREAGPRQGVTGLDLDRRVVASHPEEPIVISGFAERERLLENAAVGVWARKGKGQFVLYGFAPQFRCSTPATYKLLFNALLLPGL